MCTGFACQMVTFVDEERTADFYAEPDDAARNRWRYETRLAGLDDSTRVSLSATCEPAWEYRYRTRPGLSWQNPFAMKPFDDLVRNFRVKLSHRPAEVRTTTLTPALWNGVM